jgi:hypothetical protein
MNLIDEYFQGKVTYLKSIKLKDKTLSFSVGFPETVYADVIFSGVTNYEEEKEEEEKKSGEDWEAIVDLIADNSKALIASDSREIRFDYKMFEVKKL